MRALYIILCVLRPSVPRSLGQLVRQGVKPRLPLKPIHPRDSKTPTRSFGGYGILNSEHRQGFE